MAFRNGSLDWVRSALRLLPARCTEALDAWSQGVARRRLEARRLLIAQRKAQRA